tara:strand:+ start:402 stop:530 length:129 start_codon:yes stop_codon:yes gene_type:complete
MILAVITFGYLSITSADQYDKNGEKAVFTKSKRAISTIFNAV